ncbi:MAG: Fic family protein [Austwickia sp.]|nr:Fic family protein [Austwickia sp.]MCO5307785.1 Fic family protein [Austwickia sp.]
MAGLDEDLVAENSAAVLINRNVDAVRSAVEHLATMATWSVGDVDALHSTLLPHERPGFRRGLVWIGGSSPVRAAYVAPLPEHVPALMEDLVAYLETSTDPVLVKAALSHAQLETIHPWSDGNGRSGRALIQAVLGRSGIVRGGVLPISVVLGHRDSGYVRALNAYRYDPREGGNAVAARESFVRFFLGATRDAVTVASDLLDQVGAVAASWAERTKGVRAHSAQRRLLALLADRPVLTVTYARKHIRYVDRRGEERPYSRVAIGNALAELERRGIVRRVAVRDRGSVVFAAQEIVDLLLLSERRLGSDLLDTVAAPLRPAARRRTPPLPDHLRPQ